MFLVLDHSSARELMQRLTEAEGAPGDLVRPPTGDRDAWKLSRGPSFSLGHLFNLEEVLPILCCYVVIQSCPTLCNPTDCSTTGFPVLHHLLELAQTHVHRAGDVPTGEYFPEGWEWVLLVFLPLRVLLNG